MKTVTFIVKDKNKIGDIKQIAEGLWLDYDKIWEEFGFNYKESLSKFYEDLKNKFELKLKESTEKTNPAFAHWTDDIILIDDSFWGRCDEEKRCIILHELGHIKYPLGNHVGNKACDFLENKDSEYLANKYTKEIDNNLSIRQFYYWLKNFKADWDETLNNATKNQFGKLVQYLFILKGFEKLMNTDNIKCSNLIVKKLLRLKISENEIKDLINSINGYLNDCYDIKKQAELGKIYDKIESKVLNF